MIVAVSLHKTHVRVVESLVKIAAVSWHSLRRFIKPAPEGRVTNGRTILRRKWRHTLNVIRYARVPTKTFLNIVPTALVTRPPGQYAICPDRDLNCRPLGWRYLRADHEASAALGCVRVSLRTRVAGESVPVTKTPIPHPGLPGDGGHTDYSLRDHSRHTLFCGSHVIQTRYYGNLKVRAVVLRTGEAGGGENFENQIWEKKFLENILRKFFSEKIILEKINLRKK